MKRRKIIAAIVLLGGVALFFIIIGSPASSDRPLIVAKAGTGVDGSLNYASGTNSVTSGGDQAGSAGTAVGNGNMTDSLIQSYAQNILQMNNGFTNATPNATNTVSFPSVDAVSSQLANSLNQTVPSKIFTINDIAITSDNSTSSQLSYINAVGTLSRKNFAGFPNVTLASVIDKFVSQNDPSLINEYIAIINNEINGLLQLAVPSQLAAWHLENLNLWEEKLAVFTAIINMSDDPLKAAVALNEINDVAGKNQVLQNTINAKIDALVAIK